MLTTEENIRQVLSFSKKFGDSLISAVTLCQESDQFHDEVKVSGLF